MLLICAFVLTEFEKKKYLRKKTAFKPVSYIIDDNMGNFIALVEWSNQGFWGKTLFNHHIFMFERDKHVLSIAKIDFKYLSSKWMMIKYFGFNGGKVACSAFNANSFFWNANHSVVLLKGISLSWCERTVNLYEILILTHGNQKFYLRLNFGKEKNEYKESTLSLIE